MNRDIQPGQRRNANVPALTRAQQEDADRDAYWIFNAGRRTHAIDVMALRLNPSIDSHGKVMQNIPPCLPDKEVSEPVVIKRMYYHTIPKNIDGLHVEYTYAPPDDGEAVAHDIVGTGPFKHTSQDLTKFGVFISSTPIPSEHAVVKARELWLAYCFEKVAEGDALASVNNGIVDLGQGRSASNIGKDHREALAETGLQRSWGRNNTQMRICEDCGESNMPRAARCKSCHAIFNEALARERFPEMFRAKPGPKPAEAA